MARVLGPLVVLVCMILGVVLVQTFGDSQDWHMPWYFLHKILLIGVPMVWLVAEVARLSVSHPSALWHETGAINGGWK